MAEEVRKLAEVTKQFGTSSNISNMKSVLSSFGKSVKESFGIKGEKSLSNSDNGSLGSPSKQTPNSKLSLETPTVEKVNPQKQIIPNVSETESPTKILLAIHKLLSEKIRRDQQKEDMEESSASMRAKDYELETATKEGSSGKSTGDPLKDLLMNPLKNIKQQIRDVVDVFKSIKEGIKFFGNILGKIIPVMSRFITGFVAFLPALGSLLVTIGPALIAIASALGVGHVLKKMWDGATKEKPKGFDVDADGTTRTGKQLGEANKPGSGVIKTWKDVTNDPSRPMSQDEFVANRISKVVGGESARKVKNIDEPSAKPMTEEELLISRGKPGQKLTKYDPNMSLSDVISIHESKGNYNIYNQGKGLNYKQGTTDFSKMSIDEVLRRQNLDMKDPNKLFATGKYQIIPETLKEAKKALKLSGEELYTPEMQDKIFSEYLTKEKRPEIESFVKSGKGLDKAAVASAQEWASIGVESRGGKSWYSKDGINKAALTPEQIKKSLEVSRQRYQKALSEGKSEDEAYKLATTGSGMESFNDSLQKEPKLASKDSESTTKDSNISYDEAKKTLESRLQHKDVDIKNINADYGLNLSNFIQDAEKEFGKKINITSAYRPPTEAEKESLNSVGTTQSSLKKSNLVASDYGSMHGSGKAADLMFEGMGMEEMNNMSKEDKDKWVSLAKKHQLNLPMLGGEYGEGTGKKGSKTVEWWHVEPENVKRGDTGLRGKEYSDFIKSSSLDTAISKENSLEKSYAKDDSKKEYYTSSEKIIKEGNQYPEEESEQEDINEPILSDPSLNKLEPSEITKESYAKDDVSAGYEGFFDEMVKNLEKMVSFTEEIKDTNKKMADSENTNSQESAEKITDGEPDYNFSNNNNSIQSGTGLEELSNVGTTPLLQSDTAVNSSRSEIGQSTNSFGMSSIGGILANVGGNMGRIGGIFGNRDLSAMGGRIGSIGGMIGGVMGSMGGLGRVIGGVFGDSGMGSIGGLDGMMGGIGGASSGIGESFGGLFDSGSSISSLGIGDDAASLSKDKLTLDVPDTMGGPLPTLQSDNNIITSSIAAMGGNMGQSSQPQQQSSTPSSGGSGGGGSGGGGASFKKGDSKKGSASGAMGISIGVRNEESILQKAQYGIVRVV